MKKWIVVITLSLCTLLTSLATQAKILKGVAIEELLPETDAMPELLLNGAAIRQKYLIVDIYVGALYLEHNMHTPEEILADEGYKRMTFHLLRSVRGRVVAEAIYEGMRLNLTKEEAESMQKEIDTFIHIFDHKIKEGETATLDYIPGKGTLITVAGEIQGFVPGKKLYDAILSIWIGEHPVAENFKLAILGTEEQESVNVPQVSASSRMER